MDYMQQQNPSFGASYAPTPTQGTAAQGRPAPRQPTIDPRTVEMILALQKQQSEKDQITQQMRMANAMRAQGQSGAQATSPGGGRAGAPNWAQALANVYAGYKGDKMAGEANARSDKLAEERIKAMREIYGASRSGATGYDYGE